MLKYIKEADGHIDVGVLGGRVLFHVLSSFGHSDLAYKMIARPDYPSYGNWIERGATTLWENFAPDSVESPNHHFWGDISAWFIKTIAGINYNPDGNDLTYVRIGPVFITSLDSAKGYYISKFGKISVSWKREGNNICIKIQIPENVRAQVVTCGYNFEDGADIKQIGAGNYSFTISKVNREH